MKTRFKNEFGARMYVYSRQQSSFPWAADCRIDTLDIYTPTWSKTGREKKNTKKGLNIPGL